MPKHTKGRSLIFYANVLYVVPLLRNIIERSSKRSNLANYSEAEVLAEIRPKAAE